MARKHIDCRDYPGSNCTVALVADTEDELLEAAMEHAKTVHGYEDTPEVREEMKSMFKDGNPPE